MKQTCSKIFILALFWAFSGCDSAEDAGFELFSETYDFSRSDHDWVGGFSDFPTGDSSFFELNTAYTAEPSTGQKSLMITGNNHSDDLFMYFKKKLSGFRPNTEYILTFDVEFATDAKLGSVGIGGSPGESVYFKVGATAQEPKSVIDVDYYVMNIDKGNQSTGGQDMIAIGNIAAPEDSGSGYVLVSRSNTENYNTPCIVRTNQNGEIWLILGTDSGFEGTTTLYYTKVSVVFSASK
jgi:hypothetical protein